MRDPHNMTMEEWAHIRYFKHEEFEHPLDMKYMLIHALDLVRSRAGVPIYITSSYRPGDPRAHGKGYAVDIADDLKHDGVKGAWVWKVVEAALALGICRIGIYDKHVHLDLDPDLPQEVMWGGASE